LVRRKKLQKVKMQLSPESGNVRSLLPDSGKHVWPDATKMAEFRQDSSRSVAGSSHIRLNLGHFGRIRSDSNHFGQIRPASNHGRIPASDDGGGMSLDSSADIIPVAGFRRRHYSDSRILSNFGAACIPTTDYCQILAIGYQTCGE
jgi:hypothetical protein